MIKLTDAEWQVMRIVWERQPVTANEATQDLYESQAWTISTVKTLLSRLVDKGLIQAEPQGKKYLYQAIWTERECVISEMKQALHRIYGGHLRYQSNRFAFFGAQLNTDLKDFASFLEDRTDRIENRYAFKMDERQEIIMYRTKARMHSALGLADAPEWLRAAWVWDIIHLAPEDSFDDIQFKAAALFVWMQRVIFSVNSSAPYWLSQGIAAFESDLINPSRLAKTMESLLPTLRQDAVLNLGNHYELFRLQGGYELTTTAVQFIVRTFGWDRLVEFVKHPDAYEELFHLSQDDFWHEWFKQVDTEYSGKES
ncbi:MAG: BlaI/MecI/CopY family transcriptional regulator [Candidatus Izemoplasmatales bacterium]